MIIKSDDHFVLTEGRTLVFTDGRASELEDMTLWVDEFVKGRDAAKIVGNEDGTYTVTYGVVTDVISGFDVEHDEEVYDKACEKIRNESDVSGDFIDADDMRFVGINLGSESVTVENIVFNYTEFF